MLLYYMSCNGITRALTGMDEEGLAIANQHLAAGPLKQLHLLCEQAELLEVMQEPHRPPTELHAVAVSGEGLVSRGKPFSSKGSQDIQLLLDNVQSSSSPEQKRLR